MTTLLNQIYEGQAHVSQHIVQFYETDSFLVEAICDFVDIGLSMGDACIIIATEAHCTSLEERLQEKGVDLFLPRLRGEYMLVDANEILAKLMVDGMPASERFNEVVEGLICQVPKSPRHIRIFGEMVSLLGLEGNIAAALRLEEQWNELLKRIPVFSLFCAYSVSGFQEQDYEEQFTQICRLHSLVIPDEHHVTLSSLDQHQRDRPPAAED